MMQWTNDSTRRIDLKVCEPMANGFRYAEGLGLFESRMRVLPEAAPGLKAVARDGLEWLEGHIQEPWIAGGLFGRSRFGFLTQRRGDAEHAEREE